jgi:hypothetical protein
MSIRSGTTFVAVSAPTTISLAPLGALQRITVFQHGSSSSAGGTGEQEVLVVEDQAQIERVASSLRQVVEDPMKYIPTHRVEFTGELGVQSLLYGFGYLQYSGGVYRLTDGEFEAGLNLREKPKEPEVETEPAPAEPAEEPTPPTGAEAP